MKSSKVVCVLLAGLSACAGLALASEGGPSEAARTKIGVYDSRAIAVAFVGSATHNRQIAELQSQYNEAKAAKDEKRMAEIEAMGKQQQKNFHLQGFSTAPVDDILKTIGDALPALMQEAGVSTLVSKWDETRLQEHSSSERVDVTMLLIDALHPTEKQRNSAMKIQESAPIPLEKMKRIAEKEQM